MGMACAPAFVPFPSVTARGTNLWGNGATIAESIMVISSGGQSHPFVQSVRLNLLAGVGRKSKKKTLLHS